MAVTVSGHLYLSRTSGRIKNWVVLIGCAYAREFGIALRKKHNVKGDVMRKILVATFVLFTFVLAGTAQAGESPKTVKGASTVDVKKADGLFKAGTLFVDPRKAADYKRGHVPGAAHLDIKGKSTKLDEKSLAAAGGDKAKGVVFYCNGPGCARASQASALAVGWGYKKVFYFRDGFPAWKKAGLPVE
ncbi:MAG TPA: rhodanese-like domain-containing protein [Rhodospirillales bacterium]|nr:rhodanese-like domain-containing protein [Rhodospirillales bacterium]